MINIKIPNYLSVALATIIGKLCIAAISLVSIPIILNALGVERYAFFTILINIAGWFSLIDFGVGQSLQNFISESRAKKSDHAELVISAVLIGFTISLISLFLLLTLNKWASLIVLTNFINITVEEKTLSFLWVGVISIFGAFGSLIYRIWYAEHKGFRVSFFGFAAAALSFLIIFTIKNYEFNYKPIIFALCSLTPLALLSVAALFLKVRHNLKYILNFNLIYIKRIAIRAQSFFSFNLLAALIIQVDLLFLARYVDAEEIVIYSVGTKIFSIVSFFTGSLLQAFWPNCSESLTKGKRDDVLIFIEKYLIFTLFFLVMFSSTVYFFTEQIISMFRFDYDLKIQKQVILLFFILFLIRAWTDVFSMVLQSINDMRYIFYTTLSQAAFVICFMSYFVPRYGMTGALISLILSWLLSVAWMLPLRIFFLMKKWQSV